MATYQSKHTGAEIDAGIDAAKNALSKNGGTMTGTLILAGEPTADNGAANKKYVDDAIDTIALTPGASGKDGATFTPSVSSDGVLSWTNDKGLENPTPVNIKGETGAKGDKGDKGETGAKGDPGEDGFSPIATVVKNGTNATITITDKNGTTSAVISDGSGGSGGSGEDGYSPVANVTKEGKVATITITDKSGTTSVQISDGADGVQGEAGQDGSPGANGQDGVSPTIDVQQISGGNRVTITDAHGAQSFDVMNGTDGADNYTETDPTVPAWAKADTKPTYTASEISGIVDLIYPIGSIYMSVNAANPAVLFGGTWEQIKDTFLLSAGDAYEAGSTGGEAEHTLTTSEMPEHRHGTYNGTGWANVEVNRSGTVARTQITTSSSSKKYTFAATTSSDLQWPNNTSGAVGDGTAHNNMPPYLAVYVWQRTA